MAQLLVSVPSGSFQVNEVLLNEESAQSHLITFSLIIPTYNESKNLVNLVAILTQLLDRDFEINRG